MLIFKTFDKDKIYKEIKLCNTTTNSRYMNELFNDIIFDIVLKKMGLLEEYNSMMKYNNNDEKSQEVIDKLKTLGYKYGALLPGFSSFMVTESLKWIFNKMLYKVCPDFKQTYNIKSINIFINEKIPTDKEAFIYPKFINEDMVNSDINTKLTILFSFKYRMFDKCLLSNIINGIPFIKTVIYKKDSEYNSGTDELVLLNTSSYIANSFKIESDAKCFNDWFTELQYYTNINLHQDLYVYKEVAS